MPEVSVIIPTRNRTAYLSRAIASVLAQTFADWELIVIDDGTADDTISVIEGFKDARIHCQRNLLCHGAATARNSGIDLARGKFVAFLDDDDTWHPTKLEKQLVKFRNGPAALGLVYCGLRWVSEAGDVLRIWRPKARGKIFRDLLIANVVGTPSSVIVKREVILSAGAFDPEIIPFEDYEAWIRWAKVCEFDYVEEPLVNYMAHSGNITLTRTADQYSRLFAIIRAELQSQPRWVKRRAISAQSMFLASMYLQQGHWRAARREYWNALAADPFDFKNYLRLAGGLIPATGRLYLAMARTKDKIMARLY